MPEMIIVPEAVNEAGKEFQKAYQDNLAASEHLDKVVKDLQSKWSGTTNQVFYTQYQEWKKMFEGVNFMLKLITDELDAISDRYSKSDQ